MMPFLSVSSIRFIKIIEEPDMAAGGGPSLEQWKKMSKRERLRYWAFMVVLVMMASTAVAYAFLAR
jgi:hypothetical protein